MKTKREILHTLIDKLLDIEESGSTKVISLDYHSVIGVSFIFREGNGSNEWVVPMTNIYTGKSWDIEPQFTRALEVIETAKNIPDSPEKVQITLEKDKAREMGLIA